MTRIPRVLALAAGIALVGTAAWGYWAVSVGAGTGSAGAAALSVRLVAVTADRPSTALVPGGPAAGLVFRVTNPHTVEVRLTSVTQAGAVTVDSAHPGCTASGISLALPADPGVTVAAGATVTVEVPGVVAMNASTPTQCQGASFSIPVSVVGRT
jgi:hypothetical protein